LTWFHSKFTLLICTAGFLLPVVNASTVATYTFDNTLSAQQSGVAALTAVNPLGTSGFTTATVFGNQQTVYNFNGASTPADQGGLDFNTTGLISDTEYSVEMVVELTSDSGWRRLLDSQDRQSDAGYYIDPNNAVDNYPNGGGGSNQFTNNTFFDVFVTVNPSNDVVGYINGVQQFADISTSLNVTTNTLGFFLDNTAGGGQGEWSSGDVALIKVFNTALTADQVEEESAHPFAGTGGTATPEPGTWVLLLAGAAGMAMLKRRVTA
jgi:hypothetical protein